MRVLRVLVPLIALALLASAATTTYTIRRGDTLGHLASRFGVSVRELVRGNGIANPDLVIEGKQIAVPGPGSAPAAAPAGLALVQGTASHTVRPGETLASIARKYGTTIGELKKANNLANANYIVAGRPLAVPGAVPARLICPVQGFHSVVNNWGAPRPGRRSHLGNDIFAARGTPVVAPVGGRIKTASGSVAGLALYLDGDDRTTYYFSHLDSIARGGGRVEAGTLIGAVGNTGNARTLPPHLHFGVDRPGAGGPVDPKATLKRAC